MGKTLGLGARHGAYEILTAYFKDGREDNHVYVSEVLMAGMVAAALESLACSPFELIKLRAQVSSASRVPRSTTVTENRAVAPFIAKLLPGYTPDKMASNHSVTLLSIPTSEHPNLVGALQGYPWMMTGSGKAPSVADFWKPSCTISFEGWGALWRGFRSGLARDSIFSGIFFSSWQFLHNVVLHWKAVGMDPIPRLYRSQNKPCSTVRLLGLGVSCASIIGSNWRYICYHVALNFMFC